MRHFLGIEKPVPIRILGQGIGTMGIDFQTVGQSVLIGIGKPGIGRRVKFRKVVQSITIRISRRIVREQIQSVN